jgi:hypothetical protein
VLLTATWICTLAVILLTTSSASQQHREPGPTDLSAVGAVPQHDPRDSEA